MPFFLTFILIYSILVELNEIFVLQLQRKAKYSQKMQKIQIYLIVKQKNKTIFYFQKRMKTGQVQYTAQITYDLFNYSILKFSFLKYQIFFAIFLKIDQILVTKFYIQKYIINNLLFKYQILEYRMSKPFFNLFLLFTLILSLAYTHEIVDFSYSQYLERDRPNYRQGANIAINMDKRTLLSDYRFPQSCYLAQQLTIQPVNAIKYRENWDLDSYVNDLKRDFTELLKIGQQIKNKRNNLKDVKALGVTNTNYSSLFPFQLKKIQKSQIKLSDLDHDIHVKTAVLQQMVEDSMKNSENNNCLLASLNFDIDYLNAKKDYLNDLLHYSQDRIASQKHMKPDFDSYFIDLRNKFGQENTLLTDLSSILDNYSQMQMLKEKIKGLRNKIQIAVLMIQERQGCLDQIQQIRRKQKNNSEIGMLMSNLRQKKKNSGSKDNIYCQGVTKKLQYRVKNVLRSYDLTFQCAQDKQDLQLQKRLDERELLDAERRLAELEKTGRIDDIKRSLNDNQLYLERKQKEIGLFNIGQYEHDPNEIRQLIVKTENQLADTMMRKDQAQIPTQKVVVDYRKIHDYVTQIKKLKGQYCSEYQKYKAETQNLWNELYRYQSQLDYQAKIGQIHLKELQELGQLEDDYEKLRTSIILKMSN